MRTRPRSQVHNVRQPKVKSATAEGGIGVPRYVHVIIPRPVVMLGYMKRGPKAVTGLKLQVS